ncbi:MAG: hypothetical protein D6720_02810 [Gammaproteobacteria bacterium]|nr:MAG: hypothetical protein D6720_02810 [Gammaproteobacteria bacterium]
MQLVKSLLLGQPRPEIDRNTVLSRMARPAFHRLRLERFPVGVDSTHIDVALDPELTEAIASLVQVTLNEDVRRYFWGEEFRASDMDVVEVFRRTYSENTRLVLRESRARARPEACQLFQLAVIRMVIEEVDRQLAGLRRQLEDARSQPTRRQLGRSLELHDKVVILARNELSIRYRTLHDVIRVMMRQEDSHLRKMRKTVMGISWPVSRAMLVNPLVQLGGLGSSEDFFNYYPHLLRDEESALTLNRLFFETVAEWLPAELGLTGDSITPEESALPGDSVLRGHVEILRQTALLVDQGELAMLVPHEFDNAKAVLQLLGGDVEPWPQGGPWSSRELVALQRSKMKELMVGVERAGLMSRIRASFLLKSVYPNLGLRGGVDWVHDYLAGEIRGKELVRRLQTLPGVEDARPVLRLIDERMKAVELAGRHARQRMLAGFFSELVDYRYHLKLATWLYNGLDQVRLLRDQQDLSMSVANDLLQDFRRGTRESNRRVVGHVVLKADVRGSTEITAQMRARNLNPATYFSRNLYGPINKQLRAFGAEKVFVEGDAVILSLMEYEGQPRDHLAVARACGLAERMLEVIEAKNAESRTLGLPELVLGIGIAYSNEAPTYLYDEGHRIMISPAINRADRLSSCHPAMRRVLANRLDPGQHVVVAVPVKETQNSKQDPDGVMRYNVNGIELEAAAFFQLREELRLRRVTLSRPQGDRADTYHVGRYLDLVGNSHWLVVRETPLPLWMGDRLLEGDRSGRVYYEVVTDPDTIARARREVRSHTRSAH